MRRDIIYNNALTLGSLFDGIGGFPLAASRHGITPVWASEIEATPIKITRHHFPNMEHLGDITKINGAEIEPVDIVTFGSPCQDLSIAGKRAGLVGARSGLFREAIRIIEEMRKATHGNYPTWTIWENVPGALFSNNGMDFRTVLESLTNTTIPMPNTRRWANAGMVRGFGRCDISWRILDAQFWGVPQRRRRIFIVADFREQRTHKILFKSESGNWNIKKVIQTGENITTNVGESTKTIVYPKTVGTLCASGAGMNRAAGQGNETDFVLCITDSQANAGISENISPTITCHHEQPYICAISGNMIGRKDKNGPNGSGIKEGGPSFTLTSTDRHAVAFKSHQHGGYREGIGTLRANGGDIGGGSESLITEQTNTSCVVRRLTPIECERLQGFPDGYTEYGDDGKVISDSARYKALGNSIAIPCVEYIINNIKYCEERRH